MYPPTATKGNGGTTYDMAANAVQRNTVSDELQQQRKGLEEAHALLGALTERLAPILGPQPGEATAGSPPEPNPTTVLQALNTHNRSLRVLQARVQTLLDRIEL